MPGPVSAMQSSMRGGPSRRPRAAQQRAAVRHRLQAIGHQVQAAPAATIAGEPCISGRSEASSVRRSTRCESALGTEQRQRLAHDGVDIDGAVLLVAGADEKQQATHQGVEPIDTRQDGVQRRGIALLLRQALVRAGRWNGWRPGDCGPRGRRRPVACPRAAKCSAWRSSSRSCSRCSAFAAEVAAEIGHEDQGQAHAGQGQAGRRLNARQPSRRSSRGWSARVMTQAGHAERDAAGPPLR